MKLRDILIICVSLMIGVALLAVAGMQLPRIHQERQELGLVINTELEGDSVPPSLAFATVAMGAFRGLVVDILWMRADKLKEEGQFFDAKQVAEWITILQPRFGAVWEFHAWNMAYNISVAIPASQMEQRWRWVRNGYELLRDKGIPLNPKNLKLYRELGRIYQHKMGGISDDCHRYYKAEFAKMTGPIMGGRSQEAFESLAAAPKDWQALQQDPNLVALVQALAQADDRFASRDETFTHNFFRILEDPNAYSPEARDVFRREYQNPDLLALHRFCQAYEIRHTWKMDPDLMLEINRRFGPVDIEDPNKVIPLDWRHPDSHAIYWAYRGLQLGAEQEGREVTGEEVNTDRIIVHSLQNLFRYGNLIFYDVEVTPRRPDGTPEDYTVTRTDVFLRPDLRMFERVDQVWGDLVSDKYGDDRGRKEALGNGYRNFLTNALYSFYMGGPIHKNKAREIYAKLRQEFPDYKEKFSIPLAEFVRRRLVEEMDAVGINDVRELISGLMQECYYLYAIGSNNEAVGRWELANEIYEAYNDPELGSSDIGRTDVPLDKARFLALLDFFNDPRYPSYLKQSLYGRIEAEFPDLFQQLQAEMEKRQQQSTDTASTTN